MKINDIEIIEGFNPHKSIIDFGKLMKFREDSKRIEDFDIEHTELIELFTNYNLVINKFIFNQISEKEFDKEYESFKYKLDEHKDFIKKVHSTLNTNFSI